MAGFGAHFGFRSGYRFHQRCRKVFQGSAGRCMSSSLGPVGYQVWVTAWLWTSTSPEASISRSSSQERNPYGKASGRRRAGSSSMKSVVTKAVALISYLRRSGKA